MKVMPITTPAANQHTCHERNPNSQLKSLPPRIIFPNGEIIKKKMITVNADMHRVNKVSKRETTKFLVSDNKWFEASG